MYKLSKKYLYFPNFSVIVYVYTNLCNKLVKDKSYSFKFRQTVRRGAGSPWASLGSPEKSPTVLTFRFCLKSEKEKKAGETLFTILYFPLSINFYYQLSHYLCRRLQSGGVVEKAEL